MITIVHSFSYGRLSPHDRSGVRDSDNRGLGTENKAPDLGHGRPRKGQSRHKVILQGGGRGFDGRQHEFRETNRSTSAHVVDQISPILSSRCMT